MNGIPLDIIIFAAIAIFLIFRLGSVLGKRTGHQRNPSDYSQAEGRPAKPREDEETKVVELPSLEDRKLEEEDAKLMKGPLADGFTQIKVADQSFSPAHFLKGASSAFEMVLNAYVAGDRKTLKQLLSKDLMANFARAIDEREGEGQRIEDTLVGIDKADILEARMADDTALVTVKFVSKQVNVLFDKDNNVVDGDAHKVIEVTDIWTFARNTRSRDPNWELVATRSPN